VSDAAPSSGSGGKTVATVSLKTVALEGAVLAALGIGAATLLSPRDAGLGTLFPYPIWLAIALLATRYGSRGLAIGMILGWSLTAFVAAVLRLPLALLGGRAGSGPDLGALLGVVLIAWVASTHERRYTDASARMAALEDRAVSDREAVGALRATAVTLRARTDRLETSLTFLRDVATRLEGNDPVAAAQAALELAVARIGARAGVVAALERDDGSPGGLVTLASCGALAAADPRADITVASVLLNRRPARAIDITGGAGAEASDLAAPILSPDGAGVLGIVALRGVPQGGAGAAALHDLSLIAGWCARTLSAENRPALPAPADARDGEGSIIHLHV
jgi:hypothetical protein